MPKRLKYEASRNNEEISLEAAAEMWVRMVLCHLELNKKSDVWTINGNKAEKKSEKFNQ